MEAKKFYQECERANAELTVDSNLRKLAAQSEEMEDLMSECVINQNAKVWEIVDSELIMSKALDYAMTQNESASAGAGAETLSETPLMAEQSPQDPDDL